MVLVIFQFRLENCTVIQCLCEETKDCISLNRSINSVFLESLKGTLILLAWAFDGSVTEQTIV